MTRPLTDADRDFLSEAARGRLREAIGALGDAELAAAVVERFTAEQIRHFASLRDHLERFEGPTYEQFQEELTRRAVEADRAPETGIAPAVAEDPAPAEVAAEVETTLPAPDPERSAIASDPLERIQAVLGADLFAQVTGSSSWPVLAERLAAYADHGQDPAAALEQAVAARSLVGARDVARVLAFRLSPPGAGAQAGGASAPGQEEAAVVSTTLASCAGPGARDRRAPVPHPERLPGRAPGRPRPGLAR